MEEKVEEKKGEEEEEKEEREYVFVMTVCPRWSVTSCWSILFHRGNLTSSGKTGKYIFSPEEKYRSSNTINEFCVGVNCQKLLVLTGKVSQQILDY